MRRFSALIADPKVISHMESIGILVWTVHIRAFSKDGQSRISLLISTSCAVILTTALFFYYLLDYLDKDDFSTTDDALITETKNHQPEESLKDQTWIRNTWIGRGSNSEKDINVRLLELPDIHDGSVGKVSVTKNRTEYYSNTTVKETIKNLYDFHCQICGDVILKTGWKPDMKRTDSWRYLSADVHHILPLPDGGPDFKSNMMCLCPTCHRKFHSGEYRMRQKNDVIFVRDELLGKNLNPNLLHEIILY